MGNPYFVFWTMDDDASASSLRNYIDMLEPISDIQQTPNRRVTDSRSLSGKYTRTNLDAGLSVRITDERFTQRSKFRQLHAMINHAEQGYLVGFTNDVEKAYGHVVVNHVFPSTNIYVAKENWFLQWFGATSIPAAGDEICIESRAWKGAREWHKIHTVTDEGDRYKIRTEDPIKFDYGAGGLVRTADFWPFLRLGQGTVGGNVLNHDHRISYTFDCPFDYIPHFIDVVIDNQEAENVGNGRNQNPDRFMSARMVNGTKVAYNTYKTGVGAPYIRGG